jgi:ABC-type phosphate transport system substrate-binding protein
MKAPRATLLPMIVLALLTPCFAHHIAVVVNQQNKVGKLTSVQLAKIIRSETRTWPDGQPIVIALHEDSPGELSTLEHLLKLSSQDCKALIAAHKDSIRLATSDEDVLQTVKSNPGAIGFVEVHSIDGSVNLLSIDGKLPMEAGYLSH